LLSSGFSSSSPLSHNLNSIHYSEAVVAVNHPLVIGEKFGPIILATAPKPKAQNPKDKQDSNVKAQKTNKALRAKS
jgi:hypothetical protein